MNNLENTPAEPEIVGQDYELNPGSTINGQEHPELPPDTRKLSVWWWIKMPIKLIILFPFMLLGAILFVIFNPKRRDTFKMLRAMILFAWNTHPDLAKERLNDFKKYVDNGHKLNRETRKNQRDGRRNN